jgi:hypothetical protein
LRTVKVQLSFEVESGLESDFHDPQLPRAFYDLGIIASGLPTNHCFCLGPPVDNLRFLRDLTSGCYFVYGLTALAFSRLAAMVCPDRI